MEEKELQSNEAAGVISENQVEMSAVGADSGVATVKEGSKVDKAVRKAAKKERRAAKKALRSQKESYKSGRGLLVVVIILLTFNLAGVGTAVFLSLKAMDNSKDAKDSSRMLLDFFESELGMYGEFGETSEDNVLIAEEYMIKSTKHISDAYLSGDISELSDEDLETLQMASDILDEIITEDMTPYEKEKAVYDWMTKNLAHDDGMMQVIPTAANSVDNPHGVLKGRKAVCVGFATTFRLFMQMLDIECMVIHNSECYHSWDLVQLDDEWYHVDIYSDVGLGNYANFNVTDNVMGCDWDMDFFPEANGLKYNYYYNNMVIVDNVYDIPQAMRDAFEEHEGGVYIQVKDTSSMADMQAADCMVNVIDQYLMENYGMDASFPMYLNSYEWIADEDGNLNIYAITFGPYMDDTEGMEDFGDIDEEQANEALQGAFGDIFEDIDINYQGGYWEEDWDDDWDDTWEEDWDDDWVDTWGDDWDANWGVEPDINWEEIPDYDVAE